MTEKKPSFEKDLERLEETVAALEEGGLSLDESLKRFEEGITLARRCEKALTEAEKKIEILLKNAEGQLTPEPFGEVPSNGAAAEAPAEPAEGRRADEDDENGDLLF
ncbi:MAG TPA: exodeoxyribonuclease VII small subunit [Candidatus Hydrogenedentes bacterium]|nr:exodeoxyribonuclease VII small subunit [Candidatus Hydrogenedentota bacterium]HPG67722.1 exodeoxyribonuclease VII small subunit [Candidatus Hydrogenedentota bacterium]